MKLYEYSIWMCIQYSKDSYPVLLKRKNFHISEVKHIEHIERFIKSLISDKNLGIKLFVCHNGSLIQRSDWGFKIKIPTGKYITPSYSNYSIDIDVFK